MTLLLSLSNFIPLIGLKGIERPRDYQREYFGTWALFLKEPPPSIPLYREFGLMGE